MPCPRYLRVRDAQEAQFAGILNLRLEHFERHGEVHVAIFRKAKRTRRKRRAAGTICRCGRSNNKPICDGSCRTCGLQEPAEARELARPKPKP
jgi:CDGSH-type Zn-finger protein